MHCRSYIEVGFYKSFGGPVAKVFLGAVFTYQAVYWAWVKLETDEIKNSKRSACLQGLPSDTPC